jgi:hypothetical protein
MARLQRRMMDAAEARVVAPERARNMARSSMTAPTSIAGLALRNLRKFMREATSVSAMVAVISSESDEDH